MGFFDNLFGGVSNFVNSTVGYIKDDPEIEREKLRQRRETLGRPSITGLFDTSSSFRERWENIKRGNAYLSLLSPLDRLKVASSFNNSVLHNDYKNWWNTASQEDRYSLLDNPAVDVKDIPLSLSERVRLRYNRPIKGFDNFTDEQKDDLFRDEQLDKEIAAAYDRVHDKRGMWHIEGLPEALQKYQNRMEENNSEYEGFPVTNKIFPYDLLSPQERDVLYLDLKFEQLYKDDPEWNRLKTLHQNQKVALYNDITVEPKKTGSLMYSEDVNDLRDDIEVEEHPVIGNWKKIKHGLVKAMSYSLNPGGKSNSYGLTHAYFYGSEHEGDMWASNMMGMLVGALLGGLFGVFASGYYGNRDVASEMEDSSELGIVHSRKSRIGDIIKDSNESIIKDAEYGKAVVSDSFDSFKKQNPSEYDKFIKDVWGSLTDSNIQWQTFKDSEELTKKLTDADKEDIIKEAVAVELLYGAETALNIVNDKLTDYIAENQNKGYFHKGIEHGAAPKAAGVIGSLIPGVLRMYYYVRQATDPDNPYWGTALNNQAKGMDAEGNVLPFWQNPKYYDVLDKHGVWSPSDAYDVIYDLHSPEYYEFHDRVKQYYISQGYNAEDASELALLDWIKPQEETGLYKGTLMSEYDMISGIGEEYSVFSKRSFIEGSKMAGYFLGQKGALTLTQGANYAVKGVTKGVLKGVEYGAKWTGKGLKNVGKGLHLENVGKAVGEQLKPLTDYITLSPARMLKVKGIMKAAATALEGVEEGFIGSWGISYGYASAAMEDVTLPGLKSLRDVVESLMEDVQQYIVRNGDGNLYYAGDINKNNGFGVRYAEFLNQAEALQKKGEELFESELRKYLKAGIYLDDLSMKVLYDRIQRLILNERGILYDKFMDLELMNYHKEDLTLLRKEAVDAFNMLWGIESFRNTAVNLLFNPFVYGRSREKVFNNSVSNKLPYEQASAGSTSVPYNIVGKYLTRKMQAAYSEHIPALVKDPETGLYVRNKSKARRRAEAISAAARQMWGGWYSNYMDDVTTAFSSGYNIHDFNDYLATKYDPEQFEFTRQSMSSLMAGLASAGDMSLNPQAFYDAFLGMLGTVMGTPLSGTLGIIRGWKAFTTDRYGNKLSKLEIANKFIGSPMLGAIAEARIHNRRRDEITDRLNNAVTHLQEKDPDNKIDITDPMSLFYWLDTLPEMQDSLLDLKDNENGAGFALMHIIHDFVEEYGTNNVYGDILKSLKRMSGGKYLGESYWSTTKGYEYSNEQQYRGQKPWTVKKDADLIRESLERYRREHAQQEYLKALDEGRTEEEAAAVKKLIEEQELPQYRRQKKMYQRNYDEEGITEDEIDRFINAPENKEDVESYRKQALFFNRTEEEADLTVREYAAERIQHNSAKLLELYNKYHNNLFIAKRYFSGFTKADEDAAVQMAYNLTMYDIWKDRLSKINRKLTGSETWTTERNDYVRWKNAKEGLSRIRTLEKNIKDQLEKLEKYKDVKRRLKRAYKNKEYKGDLGIVEEVINILRKGHPEKAEEFEELRKNALEEGVKKKVSSRAEQLMSDMIAYSDILVSGYKNSINTNKQYLQEAKGLHDRMMSLLNIQDEEGFINEIQLELDAEEKEKQLLKEEDNKESTEENKKTEEEKSSLDVTTTEEEPVLVTTVTAEESKEAEKDKEEAKKSSKKARYKEISPTNAVINAEDIGNLSPLDRAILIQNKKQYSRPQQILIERYLDLFDLLANYDSRRALEDIRDAATLHDRLNNTDVLLKKMLKSPEVYIRHAAWVRAGLLQFDDRREYISKLKRQIDYIDISSHTPFIPDSTPERVLLVTQLLLNKLEDIYHELYPDKNLDFTDKGTVMKLFDANIEKLLEMLEDEDDSGRQLGPFKELPMVSEVVDEEAGGVNSMRDLLELTLDEYIKSEKDKLERKEDLSVPQNEELKNEEEVEEKEEKNDEDNEEGDEKKETNDNEIKEEEKKEVKNDDAGKADNEKSFIEEVAEEYENGGPIIEYADDSNSAAPPDNPNVEHQKAASNVATTINENLTKAGAAGMRLYNPLTWRQAVNKAAQEILNRYGTIVGEPNSIIKKLGELKKMSPQERQKVEVKLFVPLDWHQELLSGNTEYKNSVATRTGMIPMIAVVQDDNGNMTIDGIKYTAIGLAPSSIIRGDAKDVPFGALRWGVYREQAILQMTTLTDLEKNLKGFIIKAGTTPVTLNVGQVDIHTPASMSSTTAKSVNQIAFDYLGYEGDTKVFNMEGVLGTGTEYLTLFMRNFFKNLIVATRNENKELRYQIYDLETNSLIVLKRSIFDMTLMKDGKLVRLTDIIKEASSNETVARELLNHTSGSSVYLRRLAYDLQQSIRRAIEKVNNTDGITEEYAKDKLRLTQAFKDTLVGYMRKTLNDYFNFGNKNNKANLVLNIEEYSTDNSGGELRHFIKISNNLEGLADKATGFITITFNSDFSQADFGEIGLNGIVGSNYSNVAKFINNILFKGSEGNGERRLVNIKLDYNTLENLQKTCDKLNKNETEDIKGEDYAILNYWTSLFKDGILAMFHNDIKTGEVTLYSPVEEGKEGYDVPIVPPKTTSEQEAENPTQPIVDTVEDKGTAKLSLEEAYKKAKEEYNKLVESSRKLLKEWKERHKDHKGKSIKRSFSATSISDALSGDYFDDSSPWAEPSRNFGTHIDSFIREFFLEKLKRENYKMLSDDAFNNLQEYLGRFKEKLIRDGETIINTEEIIIRDSTKVTVTLLDGSKKVIDLPGEHHFDMITLDTKGDIHIYDFKTFSNPIEFLDKMFDKYAIQLNTYKRALEKNYNLKVASLKIIPIQLIYDSPVDYKYEFDTQVKKYLENGEEVERDIVSATKDGKKFQFNSTEVRFGLGINYKAIEQVLLTGAKNENYVRLLKSVGFNDELIKFLNTRNSLKRRSHNRKNSTNDRLKDEIESLAAFVTDRNPYFVMPLDVTTDNIDVETLPEESKKQVMNFINNFIQQHEELTESTAKTAKVQMAEAQKQAIESDLLDLQEGGQEQFDSSEKPVNPPSDQLTLAEKEKMDKEAVEECFGGGAADIRDALSSIEDLLI